ncbi:hypothetical protein R5W23_005418 [Gemmata sp. JC673]|uniref:Uncharacterized protein n=1 Tax=Gemmata algarum TaxID=2975278 RepID=A0ABU5F867_9BACT|nr:hypothetical protein [Gemmata algarum]MDY3563796.1 hypothetical protein [Gemmata algarum]
MATAPSPNDLTRQQLDELDALLQKMLTVPLAPVDPPTQTAPLPPPVQPPGPPNWRPEPPVPAPSLAHLATTQPPATLKFEPPAVPTPPAPPAPVAKSAPAPAPTPVPVPKPVAAAPAPKAPPTPTPKSAPAPAPKQAVPSPTFPASKVTPVPVPRPAAPPTPAPAPSGSDVPVPLPAIPFVALNGLFDGICELFGPPGRLLRSGFFKNLYGFAGLGLIVYTGLHVAQAQGWLSLPVQLPWPK